MRKGKLCLNAILLMALLIFTVMSIVGCGTPTKTKADGTAKKEITIGRVILSFDQPYQQADMKASEAYAKELGINLTLLDGKMDSNTIANAMSELIAKKVDGIIVQPLDGAAIDSSITEAHKAGIPVVTFFEKQKTTKAPYVRINEAKSSFELGALAAKKWKEFYPDKPIFIGVVDQPEIAYVHENRALPFIEGVKSVDKDAKVAAMVAGGGLRDKAFAAAQDLLQAHPEANIIYGINADSALGALSAYQMAGRGKAKNGIPLTELIVGTDGTEPEILQIINPNSAYKITMALQPAMNAKTLIDTCLKTIKGEYKMDEDKTVDTFDVIMDYWSYDVNKFQSFLKTQYFMDVDLKAELAKMVKE
ncbi:substrate-binding domain-containing protein [Moorella naiadis]|uniref:sugar ABC transporter substrate-binding protein n=1 Tax=Moorella naiadis (nom. illeg.) TaxID=3093670 RepID=UPI003D9C96CE